MYIHLNKAAYTPNTLNMGSPRPANRTHGKGFFTAPGRAANGPLVRELSPSFQDHWSQVRLFYNSLHPTERQFLVNALRLDNAGVQSESVRRNVITQLNLIDNNLAKRVARAIGIPPPAPESTFYHNKKTVPIGAFGTRLAKLDGLKIALLTSGDAQQGVQTANRLRAAFNKADKGVDIVLVGPSYDPPNGVNTPYSAADGAIFDGVVVVDGLVTNDSTLYPNGRPLRIVADAYMYGKPIGAVGSGSDQAIKSVLAASGHASQSLEQPGVYLSSDVSDGFAQQFLDGLRHNRFLNRFPLDADAELS